jgi:hypothetical protein
MLISLRGGYCRGLVLEGNFETKIYEAEVGKGCEIEVADNVELKFYREGKEGEGLLVD